MVESTSSSELSSVPEQALLTTILSKRFERSRGLWVVDAVEAFKEQVRSFPEYWAAAALMALKNELLDFDESP